MADLQRHDGARRTIALACGVAAGSYAHSRRRRRRSAAPRPVANLTARQAKTVGMIAHVVGVVAMAVFAAYYVATMCQLGVL
jgi:cytochrome c-type biogenesis protein CcmH/NrfG